MKEPVELQILQTALNTYRQQFRTASPRERSLLLLLMQTLTEKVDELRPKKKPVFQKFSWDGQEAA